ncbi:MAG: PPC domain-containing protein, partial [Verrucomicrobiota bacterium]
MNRLAILMAMVLASSHWLRAAPPQLDGIYPAGGQVGTEFEVALVGKFDPWPAQVWCENPDVHFTVGEKAGSLRVNIAPEAIVGPTLVRVFNGEGSSLPRLFVVGPFPEQFEGDNNDLLSDPEALQPIPLVMNGKLEKRDDIDFFQISLQEGETLTATLDGYGLGSAIDPFLHLYGPSGFEVALASDSHNLDPILSYPVSETGKYTVQVVAIDHKASTNVSFAGGAAMIYRLTLRTDRPDLTTFPTGASALKNNQRVESMGRYASYLSQDGTADSFRLSASKGQKIQVIVEAQRHGSPLDAVLRIVRPDGKDYKTVDDFNKKPDPELLLSAPLEGDYEMQIWDRFQRGGPEFRYHLVLEEPKPTSSASTSLPAITLEAGKSVEIPIKLTRLNGHEEPLSLQIDGLPPGVQVENPEFPEKSGEVKLKLEAKPETEAGSRPLTIRIEPTGEKSL